MPRIVVNEERCKGCGLCKEACSKQILEFAKKFNAKGYTPIRCIAVEQCIGCAFCAITCPDVAIEVYK